MRKATLWRDPPIFASPTDVRNGLKHNITNCNTTTSSTTTTTTNISNSNIITAIIPKAAATPVASTVIMQQSWCTVCPEAILSAAIRIGPGRRSWKPNRHCRQVISCNLKRNPVRNLLGIIHSIRSTQRKLPDIGERTCRHR